MIGVHIAAWRSISQLRMRWARQLRLCENMNYGSPLAGAVTSVTVNREEPLDARPEAYSRREALKMLSSWSNGIGGCLGWPALSA